jgi:hypothetical protein
MRKFDLKRTLEEPRSGALGSSFSLIPALNCGRQVHYPNLDDYDRYGPGIVRTTGKTGYRAIRLKERK